MWIVTVNRFDFFCVSIGHTDPCAFNLGTSKSVGFVGSRVQYRRPSWPIRSDRKPFKPLESDPYRPPSTKGEGRCPENLVTPYENRNRTRNTSHLLKTQKPPFRAAFAYVMPSGTVLVPMGSVLVPGVTTVLRGPELNRRLEVMSLPRYLSSTPLYRYYGNTIPIWMRSCNLILF